MKTFQKKLLFLFLTALLITPFTSAADEIASVFVDGKEVSLAGTSAYLDTDAGLVMASADLFSNVLEATVQYHAETGDVVISKENTTITMTVDHTEAKLDNRNVVLDAPPVEKDGTLYVPLRFCAETLGYELTWNSDENRVDIQIAYQYELGITREQMLKTYGTPSGTMASEKGYEWQVYNTDYTDYQLIGLDEGRVVAYYVNSETWKLPSGVQYGTKLATCQTMMNELGYQSTAGSGYTTYTGKDTTLTVYYTQAEDSPIYAALLEYTAYTAKCEITSDVLTAMERTLADLTNIMRVQAGLEPLPLDQDLSAVARSHADDMAENNFFAHLGTDGLDKTGRMEAAGYGACYISEAISKAYPNSFATFASFYTDVTYAEVLAANFDTVGVGYSYNPDSEGVLYCVQLYYAEKN